MSKIPHRSLSTALIHLLLTIVGHCASLFAMNGMDLPLNELVPASAGAVLLTGVALLARPWWDASPSPGPTRILDARSRRLLITLMATVIGISVGLGTLEFTLNSKTELSSLTWVPQLAALMAVVQIAILLFVRPIAASLHTTINGNRLGQFFLAPLVYADELSDEPALKQWHCDTPVSDEVVAELRERVASLHLSNRLLLTLIVGIIGAAAAFIVFAGSIATRDTLSLDKISIQRSVVEGLELALLQVEEEREAIQANLAAEKLRAESSRVPEDRRATAKARVAEFSAKLDAVGAKLERRASDYKQARQLLSRLEDSRGTEGSGNESQATATNLLLAAGITRFGVLALAIFLVQILLNLHRFNAEVATQYQSQIDSIKLRDFDGEKLKLMLSILKVDVKLSKVPSQLPQRAIDQIMSAIRKPAENKVSSGSGNSTSN